jgi:DNA end-binding protein Ku
MPPRPIWKGHLKLSLVSFAVRLHSATETSTRIRFNYLHRDCGQRLKQQMICPVHGEIPRTEMVKGYEYEEDRYVVVEPEELKRLEAATSKTIEMDQFIKQDQLESIYLDRPYYLAPDGKVAQQPFYVIHEAMNRTRKIGIGRMVMHGSEHMVALQLEGKGFRLTTLNAADEIRNPQEFFEDIAGAKADAKQVHLAESLIDSITEPLEVGKLRDRYQEALHKLVQAKIEGEEEPVIAEEEDVAKTFNFMEALRASVGELEGKPARQIKRKKPPARSVQPAAKRRKRRKAS